MVDFACLAWKANPLYWQAVLGLKAAKAAGAIRSRAECKSFGEAGGVAAAKFGVPPLLSGTLAKCACEMVFDGGAAPMPPADKWNPRYDAVWEQAAPQDTWVRGWAPEHYAGAFDELNAQGFRIVTQQAYDIGGGQIRYDATWRRGGPEQTWVRGWAPEHYKGKLDELLSQGWRVVAQQAYGIGGGQIRYDAVWQKGGPQQDYVLGWAPEHYEGKFAEMEAQGWRVVVQQAYGIGGGQRRYDAVWRKGGPAQTWVWGWAPEHFQGKSDELHAQGFRIVTQQAYGIGGGQRRYDAVWQQGGPPQDYMLGWAEGDYDKKWVEMNANGWRLVAQQVYDVP